MSDKKHAMPNSAHGYAEPGGASLSMRNIEYERHILGGCVLHFVWVERLHTLGLRAEHFTDIQNAKLWRLFGSWSQATPKRDITPITWLEHMIRDVGYKGFVSLGGSDLITIADDVPSTANLDHYARRIMEHWQRRKAAGIFDSNLTILKDGRMEPSEILAAAIEQLSDLAASTPESLQPESTADVLAELVSSAGNPKTALQPVRTGIRIMDERLDIMPCEVIVIAARPGNGKTALAMDIAEYTLDGGGTVWIFSLEMSAEQMLARCLSKRSGVDRKRILRGECSDDEMYRLTDCMRDMMKWRWQIEDTPSISPRTLIARSRILRTTHGAPHLIVIDYLQLMEADEDASGDGNRERVVAAASRACKLLSKEMNCPILLLSQLNRGSEKRADRRPTLGDLRESGAIEQDADTVLFINRPETYTKDDPSLRGVAEIIIAKYRSGEPTDFRLHFDGPRTQFSDPNDNDKL